MIITSMMKYIFMAAKRDKLVLSLFLMMIIGSCLSVFLGSAAVIEKQQFVVVFSAGVLRVISVLGLILFVTFYMRRSFDSKEIDYLLSRPVSRGSFVISHILAFMVMGVATALLAGVSLYIISYASFGAGHLLWIASLVVELVIMANVAFFFAMVLTSASSSALACVAFYALARIMGQILGILDANIGFSEIEAVNYLMRFIGMVIPRFDLLGQTSWLIYGFEGHADILFMGVQLMSMTLLLAAASFLDLSRRQF